MIAGRAELLDPFERWMVRENVGYARAEGVAVVVARLRAAGYSRVAAAVELDARAS